jgi:hypothetical protein
MLRVKTVLVIGAGASLEAGLPLGATLAAKISSKLNFKYSSGRLVEGDGEFASALNQCAKSQDELHRVFAACRRIHDGVKIARSIDNYIDSHRDDADVAFCGKLAIVDSILESERKSKLWLGDNPAKLHFDMQKLGETWYFELADILCEGKSKNDLTNIFENLNVISFNYDRCLQQALMLYLISRYHVSSQEGLDIVAKLNVFYPYGSIGDFPPVSHVSGLPFGVELDKRLLIDYAKRIRTYTEQNSDESFGKEIRAAFDQAKVAIFLGCAYHPQNVSLLSEQGSAHDKKIFGTAIGISKDGVTRIVERLVSSYTVLPNGFGSYEQYAPGVADSYIRLHDDLGCGALLKYYRESLRQ